MGKDVPERRSVQEATTRPHTEVVKPSTLRGQGTINERQGLARIAAKARTNANEKFSNLAHQMNRNLVEASLRNIGKQSAPGVDGLTRDETIAHLDCKTSASRHVRTRALL